MAPATTKNQQCEKEEIPHGDLFQIHNEVICCNSATSSSRRIDKIINRSEAIVASQFQALPGDVSKVFHQKEHQTRIRNAAVSNYLIYWLRNDMDSQQNLRSFKMSSCQRDPSPNILNENYFDCEYRNFINYGFEHVYLLQKWRNEQASEEGTLSNSLPQRGTTTWQIPLSFIDLAWCEAFQNGELRLAEMAIEFHSILSNSKDHGSNKSLKEACDSLVSLAKRIEALGEKTDSESCKRYVASCMMLCEFEEAYRFALIAKIAKKVSENKIHWNKADLENRTAIMNLFWGRYPSQLLTAFRYGLNVDGHEPFFGKIDSHRNLLNYDSEIACAFQINPKQFASDNLVSRNILDQSLITLINESPPQPWTAQDFEDARNFYRSDFPITSLFSNLEFPELQIAKKGLDSAKRPRRKKDYYDIFRKIYIEWLGGKDLPLEKVREKYRQSKK